MYFTVGARNEPLIKEKVFERVMPIPVEKGGKFPKTGT